MTTETKIFDLRVLLTVTTGRLLTKRKGEHDNGISDLYALLAWLTDDEPYTHQLGRFAEECKPWLLRWFPELAKVNLELLDTMIENDGGERGVERWLDSCYPLLEYKTRFDVPKIPKGEHERKDPIKEMVDMVGKDRVIVVKVPMEES